MNAEARQPKCEGEGGMEIRTEPRKAFDTGVTVTV